MTCRVLCLYAVGTFVLPSITSGQTLPYPHRSEPIGSVRQMYGGQLTAALAVNTFRNIDRLFPTRTVSSASARPLLLPRAAVPLTNVRFTDKGKPYDLAAYLELNRVAAILVLDSGRVKLERYRFGNSQRTRWMSMSVAKSITSTLVGAAVKEGRISLSDPVTRYVASLAGSAYDGVSVRDVLMMSSGVHWNETYTDPSSDRRRLLDAQIAQVPGSALAIMKSLPRAAEPGTKFNYNTGETQVLAEVLRAAVGRPLATYLSDRIWSRFGMEADANWWLDSPGGTEIGGSGFSATLRDYGRFGLFVLGGGVAGGDSILPSRWIQEATTPKVLRDGSALEYGYLWWPGHDGAFMATGIHGQYVYLNPAAQVVIVVWGARPHPTEGQVVDDWTFCDAVTAAVRSTSQVRSER